MVSIHEGRLNAEGLKFAIIVSRFNDFISQRLLEGAIDALIRHGADPKDVSVFKVPGAFEIPLMAKKLAQSKAYHAIIATGAVIRGGTPHFEYVASEVAKGIALVSLETEVPVAFGVLTTDNLEQAIERAGSKAGNKGAEAAMAAIEMANLLKEV